MTRRQQIRAEFEGTLGFRLDGFQKRAIDALQAGRSVLVAAPTGAGKTVVGEFCCHDAHATGGKTFYTTPIKALSNQKYRDLVRRYGEHDVGLLTGDRSINGEAPIVVMTTEVLRNMIYEMSRTLRGLRYVVLDEVHYLADRSRGAVWEEVLIQLSPAVQVAALSATVSNAEEFGDWLHEVRDGCEVVIEEQRPVPLQHHYFVNDRIYPTFRAGGKGGASKEHRRKAAEARAGVPNPDVMMLEHRQRQRPRPGAKGPRGRPSHLRLRWPSREQVVAELDARGWLPAIFFVFSRQGCESAVERLIASGVRLTSKAERDEIAVIVDTMLADIPAADLEALHHAAWRGGLLEGVAAHHAGMVPAFKEVVEVLFQRGLLKVVVATETLALGINMPARTVVIERLEKWNGEAHVLLTPGEYTQLTGRAGRRGIDTVGHAVVLYQRDLEFRTVAGLVGTRSFPLRSSFAPSYNMAVNLLRLHDLAQAETLLGASFAQFQADRETGGLGRRLVELEMGMKGYAGHLQCDRGDWTGYWRLRTELSRREKTEAKGRRLTAEAARRDGIGQLRPGDVIHLPWVGRRGLAAVVGTHLTSKGVPVVQLVGDDRALTKLGPRDVDRMPAVVDRVRLPNRGNPRQRDYRNDIAILLRAVEPPIGEPAPSPEADPGPSETVARLHDDVRSHPCHRCNDLAEHERWQYRYDDLADQAGKLKARIERRTGSLVRQLHRILAVLRTLGYVDETPNPTDQGRTLAGIYAEVDLLIAEAVRRGLLDGLDAAEVAAVCSLFVYEPRGGVETEHPEIPTAQLATALDEILDLAEELRALEQAQRLDATRPLDAGFIAATWRWASGRDLEDAIGAMDLTGGDFVRNIKQIADLSGQLRDVGGPELRGAAAEAVDVLRRGIVEA